MAYDPRFGNLTETVDPNGVRSVSHYDGFGRPVVSYSPGAGGRTIRFEDCSLGCPFEAARTKTIESPGGSSEVTTYMDYPGPAYFSDYPIHPD